MTIYADIAESVLDVLPDFTIGGPTWTRIRTSGSGITGAVSTSTASITAYVIRGKPDVLAAALAGTQVYDAPWLLFAALGTSIQANDNITDGTRIYRIKGTPSTDLGMMLVEVEPKQV
jgi:hypothetical protein